MLVVDVSMCLDDDARTSGAWGFEIRDERRLHCSLRRESLLRGASAVFIERPAMRQDEALCPGGLVGGLAYGARKIAVWFGVGSGGFVDLADDLAQFG